MQTVVARSGVILSFEHVADPDGVSVAVRATGAEGWEMHWGLRSGASPQWFVPPRESWPDATEPAGEHAARTSLHREPDQQPIVFRSAATDGPLVLEFALYHGEQRRWDNNEGRNYRVRLPLSDSVALPSSEIAKAAEGHDVVDLQIRELEPGGQLAAASWREGEGTRVLMLTDLPGVSLHWGIAQRFEHDWSLPPASSRPPGTSLAGPDAAFTPFQPRDGLFAVDIQLEPGRRGVRFVLRTDDGQWLKAGRDDFFLAVDRGPTTALSSDPLMVSLADAIVEAEVARGSWTLMHRFELCHELLGRVPFGHRDAVALLFVWMRYSAIRQLDWQRRYNTKPRELAHAQERLTQALAQRHARDPASRDLVRLLLTTVGRGGEGQRVRDEILRIMHRHQIKEVAGHFLEEWHQKLHNNTTPDDVVICEAYIAFLRSGGDRDVFYATLREGGVSAERLHSYERPIRSAPEFVPHLSEALVHDFSEFLRVLKSVHAATDLETCVESAVVHLDTPLRGSLASIVAGQRQADALQLARAITAVRSGLAPQLSEEHPGLRDIVRLDVALEAFLRTVVERSLHHDRALDEWMRLLHNVLRNVSASATDAAGLANCAAYWSGILGSSAPEAERALRTLSALEVTEALVACRMDELDTLLQPKAELLGKAFGAADWAVQLFSEEVARGQLEFIVSALARKLRQTLGASGSLAAWQIVSRGKSSAAGLLRIVGTLRDAHELPPDVAQILLCDRVQGDEDIPRAVTAVITPSPVDLLSHVAIRARNAGVLLAVGHEEQALARLRELAGAKLSVHVTGAGELTVREFAGDLAVPRRVVAPLRQGARAPFAGWAFDAARVPDGQSGGKSRQLERLRRVVPSSVSIPQGICIPFAAYERTLEEPSNRQTAQEMMRLEELVQGVADAEVGVAAARVASLCLQLDSPPALEAAVREIAHRSDMALPQAWQDAFLRIKQVWASKWNERAVLSRRAYGVADRELRMAVLIQRIVEADYAFVIHTIHPVTGDPAQVLAEVVPGLGETLVGNHPGRAWAFAVDKRSGHVVQASALSKRYAWKGGGLIFRSDSNGEDLAGYAGAGLYDSVPLHRYHQVPIEHAQEPIIWDEAVRQQMARTIGAIGVEIEKTLGTAQDIEGAVVHGRWFVVQSRPQVGLQAAEASR